MPKYFLVLLFIFFFPIVNSKETIYEGEYFPSERELANFLYFQGNLDTLLTLTLDAIKNKRSCSFTEPFIEYSFRTAYEKNDPKLLEFLYGSIKRCNDDNPTINAIYLKYLIEIGEYREGARLLDTLDKSSYYFFSLENRLFRESGDWRYKQDFNTSILKNSNINNGFTSSEIDMFGMTFEVSDDAYPVDDFGSKYSYSGTLYKYSKNGSLIRLNSYLTGEDYPASFADRYSPFFSADYILSNKDMISASIGRSYWNQKRVYSLKSLSYSRKLINAGYLKMIRISLGQSKSKFNRENSSKLINFKGFFKLNRNFYLNTDYTINKTDHDFSSYTGYTLSAYKEYSLLPVSIIPIIELELRQYNGFWAAYGDTRSYLRKNFGLVFGFRNLENLKLKLSTNSYNSNIPIYDNRINNFEFNYSFF